MATIVIVVLRESEALVHELDVEDEGFVDAILEEVEDEHEIEVGAKLVIGRPDPRRHEL